MKPLGTLKRGLIFVVSAPAGTGKTTLVRMLTEEFSCVFESISYTTRAIRPRETEGRDYHFIERKQFEEMLRKGEFLEHADVFGEHYGTSRNDVEEQRAKGHHVVLVIDTQGAMQLKKILDAVYIFISPPSMEELTRRLNTRKSESKEAIQTRLSWAEREMQLAPHYDYHIVNANLKVAYDVLRSIFIAEEHKNR
jgi:guanylate kinase